MWIYRFNTIKYFDSTTTCHTADEAQHLETRRREDTFIAHSIVPRVDHLAYAYVFIYIRST